MKKIVTAIVAASLLASPAMAHRRHHGGGNNDLLAGAIGAIIGGVVVGAIQNRDRPRYDDYDGRGIYVPAPYPVPERYQRCMVEQRSDPYGNIYYTQQCAY